jgi:hypothetical protein
MTALLNLGTWVPILDGDDAARELFERHYSAQKNLARRRERGTRLFVGPGEKLILSTPCRLALFAWRRERFRRDKQRGIECAVFSNRGAGLSSELIREADALADRRWPGERHFTFVDPKAVTSANPGYCFKVAGWRLCGQSQTGLLILERLP